MPTITEAFANRHICPFLEGRPCAGRGCMAWVWTGQAMERAVTYKAFTTEPDNVSLDDMPRPDGDYDWRPDGYLERRSARKNPEITFSQRWVRVIELTRGRCGRVEEDDLDDRLPF